MNVQQSYREATVGGANPVSLVVQLYEQLIQDLRQVVGAIEKKDIELRSNRIKHAILVVGYLQSTLDFERGGKVAKDLEHFYDTLRQSLQWVQFHPSVGAATQLITDLLAVREAWIQVEATENPTTSLAPVPSSAHVLPSDSPDRDSESDPPHMNWQG
jgi:flagellar protein FliS